MKTAAMFFVLILGVALVGTCMWLYMDTERTRAQGAEANRQTDAIYAAMRSNYQADLAATKKRLDEWKPAGK